MNEMPAPAATHSNEPPAEISMENAATHYSNMARGLMTPEEVILDFGVNANIGGKIVDEKIEVHTRIIMSVTSAARLHQLLQTMLAKRQQAMQEAAASGAPQMRV